MPSSAIDKDAVFHSRFNRILAVVIWALELFLLVSGGVTGDLFAHPAALLTLAAFVAVGAYAVLWRPFVSVDDDAVTIVNVVRTIVIPWAALIDVDTKFSLSLRTPRGVFSAWVAPAPGRAGIAVARRNERRHGQHDHTPSVGGRSRPGDLLNTESGEAAYLVRERWNTLVESGRVEAGIAHDTPVSIRWHWIEDSVLLVLLVATIAALGWF